MPERPSRALASPEIAVEVGSGQCDDDRQPRPNAAKRLDRPGALPRVQCDQQVAVVLGESLGDRHTVTEPAKDPRPAKGGDAVSVPGPRRRRARDENLHRPVYSTKIPLC
jgi:hypothetical protein